MASRCSSLLLIALHCPSRLCLGDRRNAPEERESRRQPAVGRRRQGNDSRNGTVACVAAGDWGSGDGLVGEAKSPGTFAVAPSPRKFLWRRRRFRRKPFSLLALSAGFAAPFEEGVETWKPSRCRPACDAGSRCTETNAPGDHTGLQALSFLFRPSSVTQLPLETSMTLRWRWPS